MMRKITDRPDFPAETVFTIGHSTHPIEEFIAMLQVFGIETLVDIRTVPGSRHNPQFGQEALAASLHDSGVAYVYMRGLGGLRRARKDSPNTGWRNASFRGYADYMQTPDFKNALEKLLELARQRRVALMCAEAVPWRCHRSLVGDALLLHGIPVENIMSADKSSPHALTKFAKASGTEIFYPPEENAQQNLF